MNEVMLQAKFDEMVDRVDDLASRCYAGVIKNNEDVARMLEMGVSADRVFELARDLFESNEGWPKKWAETFTLLRKYGLPVETMHDWLDHHYSATLFEDIVGQNAEVWSELGLDIDFYTDFWCSAYAYYQQDDDEDEEEEEDEEE